MATDLEYLTRSVDRNRYFYGKLMTVRDFLREQEYFNSKRWLINRLLFGSGIVCGLEVTGGGEGVTVVEIQPGVAFDPAGREITVSNRERVDLSKLVTSDLPPGGKAKTDLLVCLNYRECPKEPVPSLGGSPCDETCESNRVGETYTVGLIPAPPDAEPPTPCENWLNRQTLSQTSTDFAVDRIAPAWVRQNEVFQVALKVTALNEVKGVVLDERAAGGTVIEPNPRPPDQFPTPPLSLRRGEFFVYVYQVQAQAAPGGNVQLAGASAVPTPPMTVQVLDGHQADARESEMHLGTCPGEPAKTCVPVAKVTATFDSNNLTGVKIVDGFDQQRFRYNLTRVAELLDCVRASLRAEADSPRPGHAFITFKDLERTDLQPIGPAAKHGDSFTVPRGDHVHALLLYNNSGLKFEGNQLRIEGNVGGEAINFLNPVSGQDPVGPQHLTTKHYVDARIAGLDWQESVLTRKLAAPPDKPREGDRYLLPGSPGDIVKPSRNPWVAHPGTVATWNGRDWDYTDPDEGTAVFVDDENIAYLFVEGKWIPFLATPEVAAGDGLRADGAIISVGQGPGLKVNPNDVEVVFEASTPKPVGPTPASGAAPRAARGDHTHELPLTPNGGLVFGRSIRPFPIPEPGPIPEPTPGPLPKPIPGPIPGPTPVPGPLPESESLLPIVNRLPIDEIPEFRVGLHINGPVGGANIDFLHPVWGRRPTEPRHLVTKEYVDGIAAGLDWQNSVLDKDLIMPPATPAPGARYLVLYAGRITPPGGGPVEYLHPETTPVETARESLTGKEGPTESLTGKEEPTDGGIREPLPEPDPGPLPQPIPFPLPIETPWTGHENSIATWNGSAWDFTVPTEGMAVFVEDENTAYLFVEGKWIPFLATPSVAAGKGLRADGAILSVGQGSGLRVNENDVEVVYHAAYPTPVGQTTSPGASPALARGDHTHALPLALSGGLEFAAVIRPPESTEAAESVVAGDETDGSTVPTVSVRLRINGPVNGDRIDFLNPVLGQDPLLPRHLTTKQYVDGVVAGLTWQSTVLDKDLATPPSAPTPPQKGDRYLLFVTPTAGSLWEGRQDNIATWSGRKWDFIAPTEGMAAFVADENLAYLYADGKWVQFLAPPAPVGAGDGLIRRGTDLAVGQGEGVVITPDAVSINFTAATPTPVGASSSAGFSRLAAQSDHTHELPLAPSGGLEFVSGGGGGTVDTSSAAESIRVIDETNGGTTVRPRLRVNGPVGGEAIDFLFPVFGQTPTDPRHLATKQYVDAKGIGAVAGDGLVGKENVISVGGGPGLVVGADEVHVNFENGLPQPVGPAASAGVLNTVSRGDHTHAMPDVWGTSVATGVVAFDMSKAGQQRYIMSPPINPQLGGGAITVVLGLESVVAGEGIFVGEIDRFEDALFETSGTQRFPSILLGAVVSLPGISRTAKSSTFEIWARATDRAESLPAAFRVRWWAYKAGKDFGETGYVPPPPVVVA